MFKHVLRVIVLIIIVVIAGVTYLAWPDKAQLDIAAVQGARPNISAPREQTLPTVKIADVVGWQNGAKPTPAPGLAVTTFASGLDHPRWLYTLPNGDILVAEANRPPATSTPTLTDRIMGLFFKKAGAASPSANRITLLRDADGDGVAEVKTAFLTDLNSPTGMALIGDNLFVANTDALVRFPYKTGETRITAKPVTVARYPGGGNHWARGLIASADGKHLYVSIGSASNIAEKGIEIEKKRAMIIEVTPDTGYWRIFGAGLRNPQGMAWEPKSGRLFTVVNERDMLGSDLVPDYLTSVTLGDNFGWPWYYWGGYPDTRVEPANPALQQYSRRPDYALGPHVAALGLSFADKAKLGDKFTNGAFIGEHGSWNRTPVSGYKVVYVPFGDNGFPAANAKPVDVLTGFLNKDGDAQGRPVGVTVDNAGALLVADDVGNVVWRVSNPAAARAAPATAPAAN